MLFLNFIFGEKEHHWLGPVERVLEKVGKLEYVQVVVAGIVLLVVAETFATDHGRTVLASASPASSPTSWSTASVSCSTSRSTSTTVSTPRAPRPRLPPVRGAQGPTGAAKATGKAAFFLFLYLEVLDASFSFDGVIGAFAITSDPVIIAIGLGVGAMYIRSMTVHLVEEGTLAQYPYLENGALWAIGALATILLLSIEIHIPEVVTGLIGLAFIVASLISSIR